MNLKHTDLRSEYEAWLELGETPSPDIEHTRQTCAPVNTTGQRWAPFVFTLVYVLAAAAAFADIFYWRP